MPHKSSMFATCPGSETEWSKSVEKRSVPTHTQPIDLYRQPIDMLQTKERHPIQPIDLCSPVGYHPSASNKIINKLLCVNVKLEKDGVRLNMVDSSKDGTSHDLIARMPP